MIHDLKEPAASGDVDERENGAPAPLLRRPCARSTRHVPSSHSLTHSRRYLEEGVAAGAAAGVRARASLVELAGLGGGEDDAGLAAARFADETDLTEWPSLTHSLNSPHLTSRMHGAYQ